MLRGWEADGQGQGLYKGKLTPSHNGVLGLCFRAICLCLLPLPWSSGQDGS